MRKGKFIISLDFELHWGASEKWSLNSKKEYFDTTRKSIPIVLELFKKYEIHATWATVGFLFAKDKEQLLKYCPVELPTYKNQKLSSYNILKNEVLGFSEFDDPYHYAPSLIDLIVKTPFQELASHTFSHYYCNEKGQNENQFVSDLKAAQLISQENFNIKLKSLVLPRNQFNSKYIELAKEQGIKVIRSNPNVWFWNRQLFFNPLARAIDTIYPISSDLFYSLPLNKHVTNQLLLLPSSRFFRPFTTSELLIQGMKIRRIKNEMTKAAKEHKIYHLWWHPHNFGNSLDKNIQQLESLLTHYLSLKEKFNFQSANMLELYEEINS